MSKSSMAQMINLAKPFVAVTLMQFGYAGLSIISKFALNRGMSQHVLVVYRHAVATVFIAPFAIVFDRYSVSVSLCLLLCVLIFFVFDMLSNEETNPLKLMLLQESKAKDDLLCFHQDFVTWPIRVKNRDH